MVDDEIKKTDQEELTILDFGCGKSYLTFATHYYFKEIKKLNVHPHIAIENALKEMTETYMTDEKYQLLFRNMIFIDAEFVSEEDNQEVLLFNADPAIHKLYLKYWTYESSGSTEYFVLNHFNGAYDSIYCDLWNDIYLGALEGYFEATTAQLTDGSPLYVKNGENYDLITVDGTGNRTFIYHLNDADCDVKVSWDKITKTYDYNLDASELALNVYAQVGSDEYKRILKVEDIDFSGFTMYYTLINGEYYSAYITTYNSANEQSLPSLGIQFYCFSSPSFEFSNIPINRVISNASYNFIVTYDQDESEYLRSYTFNLYN